MPQTRTSARLAKAAQTEPPDDKVSPELSHKAEDAALDSDWTEAQDLKHETSREEKQDHSFEQEPHSPPKPKRTKSNHPTKTSTALGKLRMRGNRGRLADLMNLPADLFTEIASHLMPKDIISLSRLNKFFNSLLMSRSARHIWLGAMRNVPGLPPCPADMIEPHYLALIYTHNCMVCGVTTTRRMDEELRTRLCIQCAKKTVFNLRTVSSEVLDLVLRSFTILPMTGSAAQYGGSQSDVEYVQAKLKELDDPQARQAWKEERRQSLEEQRQQASALREFIDHMELERANELKELRARWRTDIEARLLNEGWGKVDLEFKGRREEEWTKLVEQPKVLTDRIWANLKPKLVPLIESNKAERLQREQDKRMRDNRKDLKGRMRELNHEADPIIKATIHCPATTSGSLLQPATKDYRYRGIFPDIIDVLEWDETKEVFEADLAYNDYPIEGTCEVMAPFNLRVWSWIADIEANLVETLRKGRVEDGLSPDIPNPTLPLADKLDDPDDSEASDKEDSSGDPFEHANENQMILLRADSLFQSTRNDLPVTYDELVQTAYPTSNQNWLSYSSEPYKTAPLDTRKLQRHAAGQTQARKILEWMGKPDATFLEMKSVESSYACGRCPDKYAHTWEGLVNHFVHQANKWETIEKVRDELAKSGVIFRDVHDPAWETNKPLVRILSQAEKTRMQNTVGEMEECRLCLRVKPKVLTLGLEDKMREHLKDMHDISVPRYREHYGPWDDGPDPMGDGYVAVPWFGY